MSEPSVSSPGESRADGPSRLVAFFVAAFAVSWAGTVPMIWGSYAGPKAVPGPVKLLQLLMLLGPGLVALAFAWRDGGRAAVRELLGRLLRWRVSPGWYVFVLGLPLLLFAAALVAAHAFGVEKAVIPPLGRVLPAAAGSFAVYLVLNTEELAWRGYAWPKMASRFGPLRAALLLGAVWALFHLPLFLVKGGHPAGYPPALFGLMLLAFGVLFAIVYEGSGGSILLAHLLHQSMNAWGDALPVYPRAVGSTLPIGLVTAGAAVVALLGAWRLGWRWKLPGERG